MSAIRTRLEENLAAVHRQMEQACQRVDRDPAQVTFIAVTKYAEPEWVQELIGLGHTELGESRPQQLEQRVPEFSPEVRWHMIGHLQRNKVRPTLPLVSLIHSVDSLRLLDRIDRLASELNLKPRVLLEVNISAEETKDGYPVETLKSEWEQITTFQQVEIQGLMTMAPRVDDPEQTRSVFRQLRKLREELQTRSPSSIPLMELSMGMSNDFEVAIEEGATLVRIGSRLYEGLRELR